MTTEQQKIPTHKLIIINDIGKELSPIGYGFRSPIYQPSRFPIETIGQLLNVSKVTAMYEVYEKDRTLKVHLDRNNYRRPFEEIWAMQNPDKEFPWGREVETISKSKPDSVTVDEQIEPPYSGSSTDNLSDGNGDKQTIPSDDNSSENTKDENPNTPEENSNKDNNDETNKNDEQQTQIFEGNSNETNKQNSDSENKDSEDESVNKNDESNEQTATDASSSVKNNNETQRQQQKNKNKHVQHQKKK